MAMAEDKKELDTDTKVEEIYLAIMGNEKLKVKGLLNMVYEHDDKIEALIELKKRLTWQAIAITSTLAIIFELIFKIKDHFYK